MDAIKAILKSIVISCPNQVTVLQLQNDYREIEGRSLPYRNLGFDSPERMLRSLTDVITICGNGPRAVVLPVNSEKTEHISRLVTEQKQTRKEPIRRFRLERNTKYRYHNDHRHYQNKEFSYIRSKPKLQYNFQNVRKNLQSASKFPSMPIVKEEATSSHTTISNINSNGQMLDSYNPSQSNSNFKSKNFKENKNRAIALEILRTYQEEISQIQNEENEEELSELKACINEKQNANSNSEYCSYDSNHNEINSFEIEELERAFDELNLSALSAADISSIIKDPEDDLESSSSDIFFKPKQQHVRDKELEEAIPDFACDTRVFMVDFPSTAVKFGTKIKPFQLPQDIEVDSVISIYITEIHNPYRFWFNISGDCNLLADLMYNIELYYQQFQMNGEYTMLPEQIQAGQVCAAVYDGFWHRAEILGKYVINNTIKVFFMDYGTVADVEVNQIKYLHLHFAELPAFAFRGSLSNIVPLRLHWSTESSLAFLNMSHDRLLHAKVTEIDSINKVLYFLLCDNHEGKDVQINRELIAMNHALRSFEWVRCRQQKKERMRHERENYPTFEMLEKGEYATLSEIIDMESKGINYEQITDKMIYYPPHILNFEKHTKELLRDLPFLLLSNNPFANDIIEEEVNKIPSASSS